MKVATVVSYYAAAAIVPGAVAWPGMGKMMDDLNSKLSARHQGDGGVPDANDSSEMIGDLITPGPTSAVGQSVANIIVGNEDGFSDVAYTTTLPTKGSKACAADKCCIWTYISAELTKKFVGKSGRCTGYARAAVRQGFHDAGSWNKASTNGGADGSLILANEISRPENNGLQNIISYTQSIYQKYSSYGVTYADLIQFMANHATVTCPLGPRVRTYVGRVDSNQPAPDG